MGQRPGPGLNPQKGDVIPNPPHPIGTLALQGGKEVSSKLNIGNASVMMGNALGLEERVARIEGILEQIDKRFDQVDKRISEFREDFSARLNNLETELRELGNRIWWVIGIQISMWVTIILAILIK